MLRKKATPAERFAIRHGGWPTLLLLGLVNGTEASEGVIPMPW